MKTVTLFTKPRCSLCRKAERVLRAVQKEHPFKLVKVDITQDEEAFRRYCDDIPVVWIDGTECFRHTVEEGALKRRLRAP